MIGVTSSIGEVVPSKLSDINITNEVYTAAQTDQKIVELAPAPGDYDAVSNAAMNARNATDLGVRGAPQGAGTWFVVSSNGIDEVYTYSNAGDPPGWVGRDGRSQIGFMGANSYYFSRAVSEGFFSLDNRFSHIIQADGVEYVIIGYTNTIAQVSQIPQIPSSFDNITDGTNTIDAARNVYETSVDVHAQWRYYGNGVLWGVLSWDGHEWKGDEPYPNLSFNDGTWTFKADQSVVFSASGSISDTVVTNFSAEGSTVNLRIERETSISAYLGKLALTNDIPPSVQVVAPSTNAVKGIAADAQATGTALYTGFTEWEFSGEHSRQSVKSLEWSDENERWEGIVLYGATEVAVYPEGDKDATSLSLLETDIDITATRHLITPTKTSQLTNDGTNGVPFALTTDIPQVVSPSTNAVAGTAADAKTTGMALFTGFTAWEFSGVPSGLSVLSNEYYSSSRYWRMTLSNGEYGLYNGYADSTELSTTDITDGSDNFPGGISATRHIVTPTKTSQLVNNGDGISPFSTTQYVDRAMSQMWIDTSTTPATTNFNQNFVPLFHNGYGLDAFAGNGYYEDEYGEVRVYNTGYGILIKDPSQTTYNRAERYPNTMWGVNFEPLGFSFNLGKNNSAYSYKSWGAGTSGDTYSYSTDEEVLSWTNIMVATQPLPYIERPTFLNDRIGNEENYIKRPVSSMAVLHGLKSGWINGHRLYTENETLDGGEYHYSTTIVGTDIPQTTNANAVSVGTRLANVLDDRVVLSSNSWRQTDGAYVMKPIAFTAMGADGVLWGNDDANQYILLYQNTTYHYLTNKPSTSPSAYSVSTFAGTSDSTEIDFGEYGKFRRTSLTDTEMIHSIYSDQLTTAIDGIATNIADGTFKAKRIYTDDGMMFLDATGVLSRVTFNLGETLTMSNVFGEAGVTVTYTNIPNAQIPAYLVDNPTGIHADEIKDYMGLVAWSSAKTNWLGFADTTTVAELIANYGADLSGAMYIDFTSRYATSPETTEFEFGIFDRYWPAYIPRGSTASEAVNSVVFSKGNAKIEGSMAQGYGNVASGQFAHAEGTNTTASGRFAHAEGNNTKATGWQSHSEGYLTKASGISSHAGGSGEGTRSDGEEYVGASGLYSFTMGLRCNATNIASFAQGSDTAALGKYSHSEGYRTTANGNFSHAEGLYTDANGEASFAGGKNARAAHNRSFVWQGNNPPGGDTSWRYESNNAGTFNINPVGGIAGFFIGDSNLPTTLYNAITSSAPIEVRTERDNADGTTTTFTTNMPPIREAVENVSVAALLKPSSALEGWSLPEYISVLKKYEWDSKAQVCYRREVTNDYIILKAVTNIDLTAAGNIQALKVYEDSIAVRKPPQVTSGYTVGYESASYSDKIIATGGDYVLEGNNLSGASVRITYEVSGTPTTEAIPDSSITTTTDTITIASAALANARSNGGTVTFAIQTAYGSTTATAVVASVSP